MIFEFKKKSNDSSSYLFLILFIVALISVSDFTWLLYEKIPPHWDMSRHLWTSLLYLNMLHLKSFYHLWTDYYYYPPLRYWLTLPFYLAFGKSITTAVMSNVVFVLILAFSLYETGRILWGKSTGLLAVIGILCSPMFIGQFKEYQLDAPLAAMVALSLCLLIKAKDFSSKKFSVLFGLSCGLGMLTKWTFICCLFLPASYALFKSVFESGSNRNKVIENIFWACFLAAGVSFIWYTHPHMLKTDFFGNGIKSTDGSFWSLDSIFWYLQRFESIQMYLIPSAFFLIGFVTIFFHKGLFEKNLYPFLLIVGCYFSFTLMHHDIRYTMPMLVGVFIVTVYWIELIENRIFRSFLKVLFVFYCCFAFWVVSFGTKLFSKDVVVGPVVIFDQSGYGTGAPDSTDWHQEDVFKIISQDKTEAKETAWQGPDPDIARFNNWGIAYYALKYDVKLKSLEERPEYFLKRTYLKMNSYPGYEFFRQFVLPDQSFLYLMKRKYS